jgi:hypothetical protein
VGSYAGGAFVFSTPVDLTGYDALTFWARCDLATGTFDVVGFGDDGRGGRTHFAQWGGVPIGTSWAKYVIPIPDPSKLTGEVALFHLARGGVPGGFRIWLDDVKYETLGAGVIGTPTPNIASDTFNKSPGDPAFGINGASVVYSIATNPTPPGTVIGASRDYFSWSSDDSTVASVDAHGMVIPLANGTAHITAKLGAITANGSTTVIVAPPSLPTTLPPVPSVAVTSAYSLYSSVTGGYNGTSADKGSTVDTWRTGWSSGTGGTPMSPPISVGGSSAAPRKYMFTSSAQVVGIEFIGTPPGTNEVRAATLGLTRLHVDVWTPDNASNFQVKLVDFGADAAYGGGDDTEGIATLTAGSTPPLETGRWLSYELTLDTDFPGLTASPDHLAQMVLVAPNGGTMYLDNIYFY